MKFSIFTTLATVLVAAISATPITNIEARDVYVPPITYPSAGITWTSGQTYLVTWDTSNPPVNITNKVGRIYLRKANRITPVILANNFDILLGIISVVAPNVVEGSDYSIVLFGDSGNWSPDFTNTGSGVPY